ncbi:MAG: hypothetical protein FJX67_07575 [Alphaproteobacteria bacterium]|nr:hypothetical protein [Alphaproteobacteria bacterium]
MSAFARKPATVPSFSAASSGRGFRLFGGRGAGAQEQLASFMQMVDAMPVNVMTLDLATFQINYANKTSLETLKRLQHLLPCKVEDIVGQTVDIFHKTPQHQRRLLADPKNLPHRANIKLGDEILELLVSPVFGRDGAYAFPMLTWQIVTDKVKAEADQKRLLQMLDEMPINVMTCDPEKFEITYMNKTSLTTLKAIEHLLPIRPTRSSASRSTSSTRTRPISGASSPIRRTCRTTPASSWGRRRSSSACRRSRAPTAPISARW